MEFVLEDLMSLCIAFKCLNEKQKRYNYFNKETQIHPI